MWPLMLSAAAHFSFPAQLCTVTEREREEGGKQSQTNWVQKAKLISKLLAGTAKKPTTTRGVEETVAKTEWVNGGEGERDRGGEAAATIREWIALLSPTTTSGRGKGLGYNFFWRKAFVRAAPSSPFCPLPLLPFCFDGFIRIRPATYTWRLFKQFPPALRPPLLLFLFCLKRSETERNKEGEGRRGKVGQRPLNVMKVIRNVLGAMAHAQLICTWPTCTEAVAKKEREGGSAAPLPHWKSA